jgi:nicotinate-nucleotide--dimethylbenzimidazole phosphoribosyltransferase
MNAREAARYRWDHVAKPLHSLGRLEDMIVQIAGLQGTPDVRLDRRCALVFCADHGVVAEGVSQSGSEVTARVARSIAAGEANVNLMASVARADVFAVDMGMLQSVPGTLNRRVAAGTRNLAIGSAMSRGQALQAMRRGAELVGQMKDEDCQIVAVGEMGIGNTTAAAAVACALLELAPEDCVGRGAGLSDAGLARKREVVRRALEVNAPDPADPVDVLSKVGGFELCGMAGAFLGGWEHRLPMIIDGAIAAVCALVAVRLRPEAAGCLLPSHMSREPMARYALEALGLRPVIDADMALGEGTGAVALLPLLDMALKVYGGGHTFESLDMAAYEPQGGEG